MYSKPIYLLISLLAVDAFGVVPGQWMSTLNADIDVEMQVLPDTVATATHYGVSASWDALVSDEADSNAVLNVHPLDAGASILTGTVDVLEEYDGSGTLTGFVGLTRDTSSTGLLSTLNDPWHYSVSNKFLPTKAMQTYSNFVSIVFGPVLYNPTYERLPLVNFKPLLLAIAPQGTVSDEREYTVYTPAQGGLFYSCAVIIRAFVAGALFVLTYIWAVSSILRGLLGGRVNGQLPTLVDASGPGESVAYEDFGYDDD